MVQYIKSYDDFPCGAERARQLLQEVSEEHIRRAYSLETNKEKAVELMAYIYELANMKAPRVEFFESPRQARERSAELGVPTPCSAYHGSVYDLYWIWTMEFFYRTGLEVPQKYLKYRQLVYEAQAFFAIQLSDVALVAEPPRIEFDKDSRMDVLTWKDGFTVKTRLYRDVDIPDDEVRQMFAQDYPDVDWDYYRVTWGLKFQDLGVKFRRGAYALERAYVDYSYRRPLTVVASIEVLPEKVSNKIRLEYVDGAGVLLKAELSCVHTAVYVTQPGERLEEALGGLDDLLVSTENLKSVHIEPLEHLVALMSFVHGLTDLGLADWIEGRVPGDAGQMGPNYAKMSQMFRDQFMQAIDELGCER